MIALLLKWIALFAACQPLEHLQCSRVAGVALCRQQLKTCMFVDNKSAHECLMSLNFMEGEKDESK